MTTTVEIRLKAAEDIVKRLGLAPGGDIQKFLNNELVRMSDPYVPFDNGPLKNQVYQASDGTWFEYLMPYARYHWYGKLMVDPVTKKGAFYKEGFGYWSRPGVPKELTNKKMNYRGSPMRGPMWTVRAWADNKEQVLSNLERRLMKK